jgi:putative FmdB family regulatory protein
MPLYEYRCGDCRERFEQFVVDSTEVVCRGCGSPQVQKLLSVFAVGGEKSRSAAAAAESAAQGCGSCGDPRGPGSCSMD